MKNTLLLIALTVSYFATAQQYAHPQTLKVEHTHYKDDIHLYKNAKRLLHRHHRKSNKVIPSELDVNIMAYKLNEAFDYFNLAAFHNNNNIKELKFRLKAIRNACIEFGINLQPKHVNNAYSTIYGEVDYCRYSKGQKKPSNWKGSKSKPLNTLKKTYVVAGHSFVKPNTIVAQ